MNVAPCNRDQDPLNAKRTANLTMRGNSQLVVCEVADVDQRVDRLPERNHQSGEEQIDK